MFEKIRIKEHMEIADSKGQHVGTVDDVEGDNIKLTKSDSADSIHHMIPVDDVEKIAIEHEKPRRFRDRWGFSRPAA